MNIKTPNAKSVSVQIMKEPRRVEARHDSHFELRKWTDRAIMLARDQVTCSCHALLLFSIYDGSLHV